MNKRRCPKCHRDWLVAIEQPDLTVRWGCLRCGHVGSKVEPPKEDNNEH